jgi:hypothetical protein
MQTVRDAEHGRTSIKALLRATMMYIVRRKEPHSGVMVLEVVPIEEVFAVRPTVFEAPESLGKIWSILQRLEVRF